MEKHISIKSDDYCLVDKHTGVILDYYQTHKVNVDEYVMLFLNCIPDFIQLDGRYMKILACCWMHSTFNPMRNEGNVIFNGPPFKEFVRSIGYNITDASIDNAIAVLSKKGFLIKKCKGTYMLNPKYFFRGSLSNRTKLQMNLNVNPTKN